MTADKRLRRRVTILSRRTLFRASAGELAFLLTFPGSLRKDVASAQSSGKSAPNQAPAYASAPQPALDQLHRDMLIPAAAAVVHSQGLGDWALTFGTRTLGDQITIRQLLSVRIYRRYPRLQLVSGLRPRSRHYPRRADVALGRPRRPATGDGAGEGYYRRTLRTVDRAAQRRRAGLVSRARCS
jgi:hypothetical protein